MSQAVVFIAGLLLVAESQASDVADRSTLQHFLPKHMPSGSDASKSAMSAYDKFITPIFDFAKHGHKADAFSYHQSPAEHGLITDNIQGASPFSNNPIALAAIGVALLSLVMMLGVHVRRRLQPATILGSNGELALDMPMNTASALGDNVMEMRSQHSHKMSSSRVGWGQLSAQNSRPSTLCYATDELKTLAPAQGAMVVTKWKTGVENDIALGFLPEQTHPYRSVQRSMFVQKAFFRAYNDMRSFATASMAGPEAIAKTLGEDWTDARCYGMLRNSETQAAGIACVQVVGDRFDILHLLMTPDQRDPEVVVRSERGLLDIVAAQAPAGSTVRLSAPAAEALLSSASELGLDGIDDDAEDVVGGKLARENATLTDERYRNIDWLNRKV
jgi:hypothetical protein